MEKDRIRRKRSRIAQNEKDLGWLFVEIILFLQRNMRAVIQTDRMVREALSGLFEEKDLSEQLFIGEYISSNDIVEIKKRIGGIINHIFFVLWRRIAEEQLIINISFSIWLLLSILEGRCL